MLKDFLYIFCIRDFVCVFPRICKGGGGGINRVNPIHIEKI